MQTRAYTSMFQNSNDAMRIKPEDINIGNAHQASFL